MISSLFGRSPTEWRERPDMAVDWGVKQQTKQTNIKEKSQCQKRLQIKYNNYMYIYLCMFFLNIVHVTEKKRYN